MISSFYPFFASILFLLISITTSTTTSDVIRIRNYRDIVISSNYPNSAGGKGYFHSPCSFEAVGVSNEPVQVKVTRTLAYENGCLRRANKNWALHCVDDGFEDSLANFCNGDVWRLTPNAARLVQKSDLGAFDPSVPVTFELALTSALAAAPTVLTVRVYFNNTANRAKWFPLLGNYGGGYLKTMCPKGAFVVAFDAYSNTWDGFPMFEGLVMTCSDGSKFVASEQSNLQSTKNLIDCSSSGDGEDSGSSSSSSSSSSSKFPVNGLAANVYYPGDPDDPNSSPPILYPSPIGLRFTCGSSVTSDWSGYPDPASQYPGIYSYYYTCPGGHALNGVHIYSGYIIDGFGVSCAYVPLNVSIDMRNGVATTVQTGTLEALLPTTLLTLSVPPSIPFEPLDRVSVDLSIASMPRDSYKLQIFNGMLWVDAPVIRYGDIRAGLVQFKFSSPPSSSISSLMTVVVSSALGHRIVTDNVPLRIEVVSTPFQFTGVRDLLFNSTLPNIPQSQEFIYSPCLFGQQPFRYRDVTVRILEPLPTEYGCLTRVNGNGAFVCAGKDETADLESFCDPQKWRIIPNSWSLLASSSGSSEDSPHKGTLLESSFSLALSTDYGIKPVSQAIKVSFDLSSSRNKPNNWFPILGTLSQGRYRKTVCAQGYNVVKVTTQLATFDGATMFTGLIMTCDSGRSFDLTTTNGNNATNMGITVTAIDCTDDQAEAEYVNNLAVYTGNSHSSPIGIKFGCTNTPKTDWTGIPDNSDKIHQRCPPGQAAIGFITYAGPVLHGISMVCGLMSDKKPVTVLPSVRPTFRTHSDSGDPDGVSSTSAALPIVLALVSVAAVAAGVFLYRKRMIRSRYQAVQLANSVDHLVLRDGIADK